MANVNGTSSRMIDLFCVWLESHFSGGYVSMANANAISRGSECHFFCIHVSMANVNAFSYCNGVENLWSCLQRTVGGTYIS